MKIQIKCLVLRRIPVYNSNKSRIIFGVLHESDSQVAGHVLFRPESRVSWSNDHGKLIDGNCILKSAIWLRKDEVRRQNAFGGTGYSSGLPRFQRIRSVLATLLAGSQQRTSRWSDGDFSKWMLYRRQRTLSVKSPHCRHPTPCLNGCTARPSIFVRLSRHLFRSRPVVYLNL